MIDFQEALLQTFVWPCEWQVVWGQGPGGTWSSMLIRQHYSARACHMLQVPTQVRMQARKERNNAFASMRKCLSQLCLCSEEGAKPVMHCCESPTSKFDRLHVSSHKKLFELTVTKV